MERFISRSVAKAALGIGLTLSAAATGAGAVGGAETAGQNPNQPPPTAKLDYEVYVPVVNPIGNCPGNFVFIDDACVRFEVNNPGPTKNLTGEPGETPATPEGTP